MTDDSPAAQAAMSENREETASEKVRERAYQLWELEGKPDGGAERYWHRAAELLDDEAQSSYPPTQSRGNRN